MCTLFFVFCNALFHIHAATPIHLGSSAGEPHVCFLLVLQSNYTGAGWTACALLVVTCGCWWRGGVRGIYSQPGPFWSSLWRVADFNFDSVDLFVFQLRSHHHVFQSLLLRGSAIQKVYFHSLSSTPFSLTCFIHSVLFSINTYLLSPPWWTPLYCINSPFVVPIMIISPAALSSSSSYASSFQSLFSLPCALCIIPPPLLALLSLPACLHPYCRVESSLFLLALSRLAPPVRLSRPHQTAMSRAGLTSRHSAKGLWCPWR